jgi:type I restriction enzyme S subunit
MSATPVKSLNELIESGVIQLARGKIISKKDIAACPGSYPIYSSAKDNDGKFGEYGKFLFDEELITWSVDGGGRLFHRPKHRFSVTNVGGVLRIRDTSVIDYRYLFYALTLRHSEIAFDWVKKAHPSVIRKLYADIPLPPLPEQHRIAALLDEAFAGLATAKANAERNLQNARAIFESHLQAVFSQRGEGWMENIKELSELCELIVDCEHKTAPIQDEGIPSIRTPNIGKGKLLLDGVNRVSEDTYKAWSRRAEPKPGDLILAREAPAGNVAVIPDGNRVCLGQRTVLIRPQADIFDPFFLAYRLLEPRMQEKLLGHSRGATVQHVNMKDIRALDVGPIPPIRAQQEISAAINSVSAEGEHLTRIYERKLAALEELKKSLLHQAFNGEL